MSGKIELLPCPFCGGEAVIQPIAKGFGCDDERCVVCKTCLAGGYYRENEEKAIAAWNRRTPEPGTSVVQWVGSENGKLELPKKDVSVLIKLLGSKYVEPQSYILRPHYEWSIQRADSFRKGWEFVGAYCGGDECEIIYMPEHIEAWAYLPKLSKVKN